MELKWIARREGRLSSFLRGEMKLSAGLMNKYKWGGGIRVNGESQHTDYPVQPGDVITVTWEEEAPDYPAEDGPLTVLYEDDALLAVDKPAGMLIHPSRSQNTGTLANRVYGYYQKTGHTGAFHPMTRLDRDTFGVVLLAKNAHIHKPSLTRFRVLERGEKLCRLALEPVTGRTHQLRVHCAWMGFPILGDPQYGSEDSQGYSHRLGLGHQMLCAKRLTLEHPMTGEMLTIESQTDVWLPK